MFATIVQAYNPSLGNKFLVVALVAWQIGPNTQGDQIVFKLLFNAMFGQGTHYRSFQRVSVSSKEAVIRISDECLQLPHRINCIEGILPFNFGLSEH